ncbi:MAG: outer membrane beta-barrel protein [Acidobacteriota bacterium]|nr:outer membrane beta-barrel protein [Acidobacteriota bacterium]
MNKKRFACAVVVAFLAAVIVLPAPARAVEVKIKLYGGYGYLVGGDLNSGTEGMANMWLDMFSLLGASQSGSFQPAHYGLQYGGDLIFMFNPIIGIGLGVESLGAKQNSTIISHLGSQEITTSLKAEASAVPIKASLYLCAPLGTGARMNLHFGVGYYLAKMSNLFRLEQGAEFIQYANSADAKAIGFHGGLGFEFDLAPHVSLFIEVQGRYAKLGGFEGEAVMSVSSDSVSEKGVLYYFEAEGFISQFYSTILVQDAVPVADSSTKNIREAKIDFSGGTALGGIVFRF